MKANKRTVPAQGKEKKFDEIISCVSENFKDIKKFVKCSLQYAYYESIIIIV